MSLVYGVGLYEIGKYKSTINNCQTLEYETWKAMLRRCYSADRGKFSNYLDCTVSENFKNFQYFAEWCNKQVGFGNIGWCLDKDILVKGNKIYSEDSCVFVPTCINVVLCKSNKIRGSLPIGVHYHTKTGKYIVQCCIGDKKLRKRKGKFSDPEQAFFCYKEMKESYIKELANFWKDLIDCRVYQALINYKVEITD